MSTGYKILAVLLLAVAAIAGFNWWVGTVEAAADKVGYERATNEARERENKALNEAIAERDRLAKELEGVSRDARQKKAALDVAQRAAADVGERLRSALAALRSRAACPAAAPGGSPPTDPTERMLADVQRRLDEAQDRVARFADEAHIAGLACERAADAVK